MGIIATGTVIKKAAQAVLPADDTLAASRTGVKATVNDLYSPANTERTSPVPPRSPSETQAVFLESQAIHPELKHLAGIGIGLRFSDGSLLAAAKSVHYAA